MTLYRLLLSDLRRQFFYEGNPNRPATMGSLIKRIFNPRFMPVVLCRLSQTCYRTRLKPLSKILSLSNFVLFGIEIALRCEIDEGLYLPHTQGTVIGAQRIGKNAVIYHNVTFGAKEIDIGYHEDQRPIIGDNVIIGSGAKVLGGITVGNNVIIGANAVVIESIPSNVMVGGVPAKIIRDNLS